MLSKWMRPTWNGKFHYGTSAVFVLLDSCDLYMHLVTLSLKEPSLDGKDIDADFWR